MVKRREIPIFDKLLTYLPMINKYCYLAAVSLLAFSCSKQPNAPKRQFVDVNGIDANTKPGDNFFRHVNGIWYDTAKIDADQSGVGSYMFLNIPQKKLLQSILDSVATAQNPAGTIAQKVGDFYASGMDTATVNKRGYEPIKPTLEAIDALKDVPSVMTFVANEGKVGSRSMVDFGIWPDNKKSTINIAHVTQSGLGLPDRDYYFKTDEKTTAIQTAYKTFLTKLFTLTGSDEATATKNADVVYNIEKQFAGAHKTNIQLRDVNGNYNKVSVASIEKKQPLIGWSNFLKTLGAQTDSLDMPQAAYYDKLNGMLKSVSLADWKVYLKANVIKNYSETLSKPFGDATFEFVKVILGQDKQKSRAQLITENVDGLLGEALGQLYVKKYFNEAAKKRVLDLVNNLQKAFEVRITNLDWMSDSTKAKAKEKLYTITKKIGYPDKWREYNVTIDRAKYLENIVALRGNDYQFQLAKLNKPVDKEEWGTTPSTVTAYYNPFYNEIVFPAGILQYPYFDFQADDAINYGGIGMVIGHELTHAFDDQGAQFDKDGNVTNWWTESDFTKFKEKTNQVIDLYSSFTVLDTVHVKGALTVGENVADNGGVAIAYDAFKLTEQGKSTEKIDGYTPDQRFFLSIARIWRVKTRDEFLRMYVNVNAHSPAMWRVNGPLMNFPPFYEAFSVTEGKNFKSESERIKIW